MPNFDQLIDQLAFGKETSKPGPCLGLYLSPDVIYLAEAHPGKEGRPAVDHLVRIPIPTGVKGAESTGTMNTDFLSDTQKIAGLIRQSMSQMRWNSKNVRVTLSHHLGMLRYFTMPAMERRFLKSAIPLEAKKYIPIPFDVLAHDHHTIPLPPDAAGKPKIGVLVAVTQNKNVPNITGLLATLGLKLEGLEVAPYSVLRLWQMLDRRPLNQALAHVHMDGGSVRVMVAQHGAPIFFREVFLGSETTLNDLRKIDLAGCLSFLQKQLGATTISKLRVSGNIPNLEEMRSALSTEAGVDGEIQDTAALLSLKAGDWGGYAALGAAAYPMTPIGSELNLAAIDRISDDERRVAGDILLAGGAFAVFFGLVGAITSASYAYRAQELKKYPLDPVIAAAVRGKPKATIESLLADMRKQSDDLSLVGPTGRPSLTQLLREIARLMPEQVWLTKIDVDNPLLADRQSRFNMVLTGRAQSDSVADEQALSFKFKDALLNSELVGKQFDVQLSLQKNDSAAAAAQGMDPAQLREKLEDRTQFTVTIEAKR